jgi:hypothetical protein
VTDRASAREVLKVGSDKIDKYYANNRTYPPVMPTSASAAYLKRPEKTAKETEVNIQTAKKGFEPRGGELDSLGNTSVRNVDKWTEDFLMTFVASNRDIDERTPK